LDLLGLAKTLQSWTQGGFDPTVAACAIDWHQPQLPSMDQIEQCKPLIGMDKIDVDGRRRVVALRLPGMKLSFGGVAKGYIAELGSISLRRDGFPEHSVEAGGDLRLAATARPWRVALAAPGLQFEWREGAVASSGDQFQALDEDGRHYHHLLDPRHGGAALGLSSVSVLAPSAGVADGLATGLFALGPEEGWARACELSRLAKSGAMPAPIEALFLLSDGSLRSTPGFPPLSPLDG
ncbi:MAG: FAD:protein FMN transferase, partial [Myxococcota bacterium]|jgi:thiamine biosynthesis lipoprotein|nr:FAD:protein FMN transferase [Myxococcota bacterium]